jgi:hypothetical protein
VPETESATDRKDRQRIEERRKRATITENQSGSRQPPILLYSCTCMEAVDLLLHQNARCHCSSICARSYRPPPVRRKPIIHATRIKIRTSLLLGLLLTLLLFLPWFSLSQGASSRSLRSTATPLFLLPSRRAFERRSEEQIGRPPARMKEGRRRTTRGPSLCRKETHLTASTQLTSKLVVVATTDW